MTNPYPLIPEEQYSADSAYGQFVDYYTRHGVTPSGYGRTQWSPGGYPDQDPFGISSSTVAQAGARPLTSNEVGGLVLDNGRWVSRVDLMKTEAGRKLVETEEDIRRGMKRGFWSAIGETSWTDFVPFVGMLAQVGGSYRDARVASDFYRKQMAGIETTQDEAIAATLFRQENHLASEGTWGYTFGSIVRQAPAFFMEFGMLGKAGQAARSAVARGVVTEATDASAKSAATWATSRFVKTGANELAESAIRSYAEAAIKADATKTFTQAVKELATNEAVREQTVKSVANLTSGLMDNAANSVAKMSTWAPGLRAKTSEVLARDAVNEALRRMSADTLVKRAWIGTVQSVRKSVAEGLIDLGSWGTDAATSINTGFASAKKAALDAVTQLTFGALARGTAYYLPKEVVTRGISTAVGGKNANTLALESAAWQNNDKDLMDKAEVYGAFLDLLEYVSENTGRGFNSAGRAIGLKVAPGLMKPASKVAGLTHIVGADIKRDAAGKATKVVYNGLIESAKSAEAGGKFRQILEKAFGKRALRENVQEHRFKVAKAVLGGINVGDDVALQKTLDTGVIQPGLSKEAADIIGNDVNKFIKNSMQQMNKAELNALKYRSFQTYWIADFLTRNNIDAITAGDMFRTMGYDGIIGEMMEERYSDFASALFGLDARQDHTFWNNMRRAVEAAFAFEEQSDGSTVWKWDQLTAEAAAFAVPLVARAGTMRAIAALGGPNAFEKFKSDAALYADATRYGNVSNMRSGDYLASLDAQRTRFESMAAKAQARYDEEVAARTSNKEGRVPLDENTMNGLLDTVKRANEASKRLGDVRKHFMDSVTDHDGLYTVPIITDQEFLAPPEAYNLMLKTKESQANLRTSMSAYQRLVQDAPEMFQTMAKMEDQDRVNENAGWFRRASHWVVEHAIRLGGFAITGDVSFMSVNPARFSAVDMGVPGDVLTRGQHLYQAALQQRLAELRSAKAEGVLDGKDVEPATTVDYDKAHELALSDIREEAMTLMTTALAAHQARMFSGDEIRDIAMKEVAEQDGYATDASARKFVNDRGEEVSFDDYLSRAPEGQQSVKQRIDDLASNYTRDLFYALTAGEGANRVTETSVDGAVRSVQDILTVPKELPTANQAIVAKLARNLPQLRSVMLAKEVDGNKLLDDQFNEVAVDQKWMDMIVRAVLPIGAPEITADTNMEAVYARINEVHPGVLATVARSLNIRDDGTRKGVENRNRELARLAVMSATAADKDLLTFARMVTEAERKSRFSSPFGVSSPARFNGKEWVSRIVDPDSNTERLIRANTVEELVSRMQAAGYTKITPKTVFTSVKMLQSSDALSMIRVLGLGSEYERRMLAVADETKHDPLLRRDEDGMELSEEEADKQREKEKTLSDLYDLKKSADPALYLRAGERLTDSNGRVTPEGRRAGALAQSCKDAWFRRNGRSEDGKTAYGYIAVANDLLRDYGVTVPFSSTENVYGTASQGRRGKYTIGIRTAQARGLSRNVYVPIDHENAQNYESALLEASLFTEYAKHRIYLSEVYRSQTQSFMDLVNDVCLKVSNAYRTDGNERMADLIEQLRVSTVARPEGKLRLPSPQTFAQFVSAFNLFRTEVPGVWRQSVLGHNAEALCAIAKDVRQGTAYLGWTAVVDRILGGTGLEVSALNNEPPKTGLGRYYALWAPQGSKTLDKAIEAAVPGGMTFTEFADRATHQAQATVQSAYENARRNNKPENLSEFTEAPVQETASPEDDVYVPPTMGPMAPLAVAQQIASTGDLDIEGTLDVVADAAGETRASSRGGDAAQATETTETPSSEDEWDEGEVTAYIDDDMSMDRPDDYFDVTDVGTVTVPAQKDHLSLSPSETKVAIQTFVKMAVTTLGIDSPDQLTPPAFKDFLVNKVAVNKRPADIKNLVDTFREMRKAGDLSTDVSWSLNDVPESDEEGILPDGAEGNAQRSVEILKSKALSNWLAMFSLVSPQTGRDFQPLVEDLRSVLRAAPLVMSDRSPDLVEADEFLNKIINPRGLTVGTAPERDTRWRHQMSWFEQASGHRKDIVRYIQAYLGKAGEPPVNARGALLLSYLLNVADKEVVDRTSGQRKTVYDAAMNVRMSLASLIGSSAAAQPVKLSRTDFFGYNDNFNFVIEPRKRRGGYNNLESVVSAFSRLSNRTGDELAELAGDLEKKFRDNINNITRTQMFGGRDKSSFTTWASILAPVFGFDSPIVSVFLSRPMYGTLFTDSRTQGVLRSGFSSVKVDKDGHEEFGGIPFAAFQLIDSIRRLGKDAGSSTPSYEQINAKAVELFQSGSPSTRSMANMETTLQGQSVWMSLFRAYADARPVSVMTAEVDPERTNKPASSLAITMPGLEPALLEFMDRTDDKGYASVLKTWFPERLAKLSESEVTERIADWKQRMIWPNAGASLIVAKSVSKSALASEVLNGCETVYNQGNEQDMVYVPVYSGDHSSSIIIQVPLLTKFKEAGKTYDEVAEMISSWVGLNLLGTDAKRSSVTSMEAPGTSMWDYEYDDDQGNIVVDDVGKPSRGHAYMAIVWNSDPDANNEALIGTSGIYGYGAERQKELAKDPKSSTLKVHIASTAEDTVYGPLLTLIKSLAVAPAKEGGRGQFTEGHPMKFISDHAWSLIDGEEKRSTVTITDFDSIKLSQANSKTIGVNDGSGKPVALMKHVFAKLNEALVAGTYTDAAGNAKKLGSEISGEELDQLIGDIDWVNLGGSGKKGTYKLSQLLAGAKIKEVKRPGDHKGHKMFSLVFEADNQMAFQVANVSHKAQADFSRTPRNYMTDACAVSRVLAGHNADTVAKTSILKGASRVCSDMLDLVTSWGFTGAAISSNATSIDNMLTDDEEWQDAMDKLEPVNGDYAMDLRQRKFASEAKKNNLAIQFFNNAVPLVTNGSWIGDDGAAHSHSASKMFNDTLQGARTIKMSDRSFLRAHKRVALANVNNIEPWFRYGMYVDEQKLFSVFSEDLGKLDASELTSDYRKVVALLDHVISTIVDNEFSGITGKNNAYRKMLAQCLIDHRGNYFSDRYSTVEVSKTNRKTGEIRKETVKRFCWETVSYADLFTSVTSDSADSMEFDRAAVYESMFNDATGRSHVYLGGTMMGMPRTPSYNGSMWLQCVRAGLPVTERVDADGKQWQAGIDAMVSPDPFTLAILGCDHDGDKANLYMIRPGKNGSFELADLIHLTEGVDDFIDLNQILNPNFRRLTAAGKADLQKRIDKLVSLGYLEYETRTEKDETGNNVVKTLGLRLSQLGKTRISNSFVSGLFDLNRMIPVSDNSEQETSVYDGYRADGETRGSFYHGVKAKPADPDKWDEAMKEEGVLSAPLLDAKSGKIIGRPRTATAVQDGAAVVSEARAIIVSMAGALHFAYASNMKIGPFATRTVSEKEWIDFMYHVDGLSNMTFDDIKEQICTRLGVRPNMIESILADIINSAESGKLPTTDREFIKAFVKYGKAVNDAATSRYWMSRASDPADYRFQALLNEIIPGYFDRSAIKSMEVFGVEAGFDLESDDVPEGSVASKLKKWCSDYAVSGATETQVAMRWADATWVLQSLMRATSSVKNPLNGFTYWVQNIAKESELADAFDDINSWMNTVSQLNEAKSYGNAVNYANVDPASNTASAEAARLSNGFQRSVLSRFVKNSDPRSDEELKKKGLVRVPDEVYNRAARMRAATAMMYDDSVGLVVAARGIRAARTFKSNLSTEIANYGREGKNSEGTTRRVLGLAALSAAPRISGSETLICESNMQSVPWTAAAITTCPVVPGSNLNSRNLYDVMEYMGRVMAYNRHKDVGVNVSLDVRYTVEAMVDLVARLVLNSSVHQQLNVFDFLKEVPDANAFGYTVKKYGPAAHGLSRITPAFQHITEAQRSDVCTKYDRVVIGRELDSDSALLKGGWKSAQGTWSERYMNFTLSTENLMRIYTYLDRQTIIKKSMAVKSREQEVALARSLEEGNRRDILETVRQLIFVFSGKELDPKTGKFVAKNGAVGLDSRFGKDFKIEPSALFGQILPVYACSTALVTGPAGTDSNSLLSVMPDRVYGRLASEVARMHNDPVLNRWSDMAAALRYAPFAASENKGPASRVKTSKKFVEDFQMAEDQLTSAAERAIIANDSTERDTAVKSFIEIANTAARKDSPYPGTPEDPRAHHTLCIFDGLRGVAFRNALAAASGELDLGDTKRAPVREAVVEEPSDSVVAERPVRQTEEAPAEVTPIAQTPEVDTTTEDIANRMSALLKMWDKGRVEYNGGTSFVIHGNFTDAEGSTFETHIDVELKPGTTLLTDEQLLNRVKNSSVYRQSLAQKSGVPEADIEQMAKSDIPKLFALAQKFAPIGASRTLHPGSADFGAAAGYVVHSGAADGSDSVWGDMAALYGAKANHYRSQDPSGIAKRLADRFAGNSSQRIVTLTDAQFREGMEHYKTAAEHLGKHVASKVNVQGLMARNWFQVKNSDAVFAISRGFDGQGILGGTGYAVQMAKDSNKPIHVFDQPTKSWYRWTGTSWQQEPTPTLTKNFAGVGTREINEDGRAAVADVFSKSFGGTVPSVLQEIGQWNLDAKKLGVLTGRIMLAHDAKDSTVIYHEFFHSVMGFMRSIGALSDAEIAELNKKYGNSAKYGEAWFNEEKAAEDFRNFVNTTLDPKAEDAKAQTGFWGKLKAFLDSLLDLVFGSGPEAFGNDMDKNPLAGIVLTGKVRGSEKKNVPTRTDFGSRLDSAVKTFVGAKSGNIAKVQQLGGVIGRHAPDTGLSLVEYGAPASSYGPGMASELASREFLILFDYLDFDVVPLLNQQGNQSLMADFERFINEVEMLYSRSDDRAQQRADMDALEKSTPNGSMFRKALVAFTKKYGPKVVRSAVDAGDVVQTPEEKELLPAESVPNPTFDSDIADFLSGARMLDSAPADIDDMMALAPEDEPGLAAVHVETSNALTKIMPSRMNRPYTATNSLALEIAKVIANEFDESKLPEDTLKRMTRSRGVSLSEQQDAKIRNAIIQVGSLFGVDVSDQVKVERLIFKAMCELTNMVSPDGVLQRNINRADGGISHKKTLVTPNDLASAIVASSGVRPYDILESTVSYVKRIAAKYPGNSTFTTNVVKPVLSALDKVHAADPANVMYDNGTMEDTFGAVISSIRAGLNNPGLNSDGTRQRFELGTPGASKNPYHDDNIAVYADHIENPDFQDLMHTVLDRLYTMQAATRWYRNIGFEPGSPEDTTAIRGIAPSFVEPMSHADTMASLSATLEQFDSPYFSVTDFFDQPAFIALHPEAWLDSVTRPNFGNTTLREAAQEEKRQIAGFHTRANQLDGILIHALGLDVLPGEAVFAVDKDYTSKFSMEAGKTKRADGSHAIKFLVYDGKKAKRADGSLITVDLNDQRRSDMTYKMWKIIAQGGKSMVTGVNDLVFALSDSADPAYYSIENVRQRELAGVAGNYSDFDRFLLRMDWQLRRDNEAQWDDILGESGLNIYNRVVEAACAALKTAKKLNATLSKYGTPELMPKDVNDFVLRQLANTGLIQSAETSFDGGRSHVRTSGVLTIPADEWIKFWESSSTYQKLVDAGRDERTLKMNAEGSIAQELLGLFNDVKRFVDAHPYLSDGDGAFFHNMSTPLPWVGGDGYTMYALNRNELDKSELVKAVESMNAYEKTFHEFIGSATLDAPASEAGDNMMRLFKVLFHTSEQAPDVIRQAMASGKYPQLREGATQKDLALTVYNKLVSMIWRKNGDVALDAIGGHGALRRMIKAYDRQANTGVVAGSAGLTDETMFRISGKVPANYQLGHAVKHAIDGITNAFMFRSTLFNMLTTPDESGRPTCYARPSDNATDESGIPDSLWGTAARWWALTNGFEAEYDITRTGVQNAQHIYDLIAKDTVNGIRKVVGTNGESVTEHYGELSNSEIDQPSVTAFMARKENPQDESSLGSYALGYAKHLFQSSRTLGTKAVTKQFHRALAWSKGLSVNFSYFFPIATRFESPSGAVGAIATFCGNVSPDWVRKHAEVLSKLQSPFSKTGWITQDFIGQKDIMSMLDSNDPYLAELYHWAGVLGIQLSDPDVNPQEHSRSYLRSDLERVVKYVANEYGTKAAKNVREIMNSILLKSGDRAFTYHLNATKLAVVAQLCTKLQVAAAKNGKAFDPVRDLKRYSAYVNAEVGGIDPLQFAWAHPVMQSRMNSLFFSWGWTRGAWEAGGGVALEQLLFGGHDVTPEQRKYYRGRWMRMFGEIMIGVPMLLQAASKVIGLALVAGLNPDDDDTLSEEEKRRLKDLIQKVHDSPWFTWQNEDKAWLTQYDLTPLMMGVTARFPSFSKYIGKEHPWLKTIGGLGMAVAPLRLKPLFMAMAAPTYEGVDDRNSTTMGRRYYQHFGKQGWEELRWFDNPFKQFLSKMSMPVQRLAEGVAGRSLTYLDHPQPWDKQGDFERWLNPSADGAMFNLLRAFVPFSISSLKDTSDAGFLSMVAPVSMGASGSDIKERAAEYLHQWSTNDRRGYAFAGMSRKKGQKMGEALAKKSVTVAHLVREAMMNGYSEKDAYALIDDAIASEVRKVYGSILRAMPTEPDGDYDTHRMAGLLRQANRLGRFRKDMFTALKKRLETQQRWGYMSNEVRRRMTSILNWGRGRDAYDVDALDKLNDKRYDY